MADDGLGSAQAEASEEVTELEWEFYDLSFSVNKSRRYHERMCAFFGSWRDWMRIITAVAGSGAFLLVTAKVQGWAELLSAFVALWAVIDIIVAPDKKAEEHRKLCERFVRLAERLATVAKTRHELDEGVKARLRIERDEPPVKRLVDLQARNDECRARDFPPGKEVPLSRWQRWFGAYATFGMERLEAWSRAQRGLSA